MKRRRAAPPARLGGRALASLLAAAIVLLASPRNFAPAAALDARPLPGTEAVDRRLARNPNVDKRADRRNGGGGASSNTRNKKKRQRDAVDGPKKQASTSTSGNEKANKRANRRDGTPKKKAGGNGKKNYAEEEEGKILGPRIKDEADGKVVEHEQGRKKVKADTLSVLDIVGGGSDSKNGGRGGKNKVEPESEPDEKYGGRGRGNGGKRRDDDDDDDDKSRSRRNSHKDKRSYHDDFKSRKPGRGRHNVDDDRYFGDDRYYDDDDRYYDDDDKWYDPAWGGGWCTCPSDRWDSPRHYDNPRWRGADVDGVELGGTVVDAVSTEESGTSSDGTSSGSSAGGFLKRKKKDDHHNASGASNRMSARTSSNGDSEEVVSLADRLRASLSAGKNGGRSLLGEEHLARLDERTTSLGDELGLNDGQDERRMAWWSGKSGKTSRGKGGKSRGSKGVRTSGWWSRSANGGKGSWHDDDWHDDWDPSGGSKGGKAGVWGWHDDDAGWRDDWRPDGWSHDDWKADDWAGSKGGKPNGWWSRSSGGKGKWHDDDWHTSWDSWDGKKGSSYDWGSKDWGSKSGGGRWWGPGGRRCKCPYDPTLAPSLSPTLSPTLTPSLLPTLLPTLYPTFYPTMSPTIMPGEYLSCRLYRGRTRPCIALECHILTFLSKTLHPRVRNYDEMTVGAPEINDDGSPLRPIPVPSPTYKKLQSRDKPTGQFQLRAEPIAVDVLSNDVPSKPYPNRLTVTRIVERAKNGRCTVAPLGRRVEYLPNRGYAGRDRCDYEACDQRDECGTATIFFDVMGGDELEPTLSPTLSPTLNPSLSPTLSP